MAPRATATATLGDLLREARQHREWSLRRVAELLGCTASYLSDVEHNRRVPAEAMLGKLAKLFSLNFDELMARAGRFGEKGKRFLERSPSVGLLVRRLAEVNVSDEELSALLGYLETHPSVGLLVRLFAKYEIEEPEVRKMLDISTLAYRLVDEGVVCKAQLATMLDGIAHDVTIQTKRLQRRARP